MREGGWMECGVAWSDGVIGRHPEIARTAPKFDLSQSHPGLNCRSQ